jgi:hypothetical protein
VIVVVAVVREILRVYGEVAEDERCAVIVR